MAKINLSQAQADGLVRMGKYSSDNDRHQFPMGGQSLTLSLESEGKREHFLLDISRARVVVTKVKLQTRARHVVVLARLDLDGAPHRNPDGEELPCPHLHVFKEGYGDKWAFPLSSSDFSDPSDVWKTYQDFLKYCNVIRAPDIQRGLFT